MFVGVDHTGHQRRTREIDHGCIGRDRRSVTYDGDPVILDHHDGAVPGPVGATVNETIRDERNGTRGRSVDDGEREQSSGSESMAEAKRVTHVLRMINQGNLPLRKRAPASSVIVPISAARLRQSASTASSIASDL
jgi:hypothetical protein